MCTCMGSVWQALLESDPYLELLLFEDISLRDIYPNELEISLNELEIYLIDLDILLADLEIIFSQRYLCANYACDMGKAFA